MTSIDFSPVVDAVANGVSKALEGISIGAATIVASMSNKPREPYGTGNAGWGAAGAPLAIEVYEEDTGAILAYWGFVGNVLWQISRPTIDERNGFHRTRMDRVEFYTFYIRWCQIMRMAPDLKAYQYDVPAGQTKSS